MNAAYLLSGGRRCHGRSRPCRSCRANRTLPHVVDCDAVVLFFRWAGYYCSIAFECLVIMARRYTDSAEVWQQKRGCTGPVVSLSVGDRRDGAGAPRPSTPSRTPFQTNSERLLPVAKTAAVLGGCCYGMTMCLRSGVYAGRLDLPREFGFELSGNRLEVFYGCP